MTQSYNRSALSPDMIDLTLPVDDGCTKIKVKLAEETLNPAALYASISRPDTCGSSSNVCYMCDKNEA